jgi:hypothetical protein
MPDRAALALPIADSAPTVQFFVRVGKASEPVGIQAFGAKVAAQRFVNLITLV